MRGIWFLAGNLGRIVHRIRVLSTIGGFRDVFAGRMPTEKTAAAKE
jgi:hypothetical protein